MVQIRLSSILLVAGSLWLSGCATSAKIAANEITETPSMAAATKLGDAQAGDTVNLPAGNVFGEQAVVVGDGYTAASGRLCRRLRSDSGRALSQIVCRRESGEWYSPRSLYSNNDQLTSVAVPLSASTLEVSEPDSSHVDNSSIVVVELGADDLQSDIATVRSAPVDIETEKRLLESGETLWSFSRRVTGNALNWKTIAELNGIDDSRRLAAGDTLLVPKSLVRGEP